jgi:hypothetical protein
MITVMHIPKKITDSLDISRAFILILLLGGFLVGFSFTNIPTGLAAMVKGKPNPCTGYLLCQQIRDENGDGDITQEFQAKVNTLLAFINLNQENTASSTIAFAAPPAGTYTISAPVVICSDATPPTGSEKPDCTGDAQPLEVKFIGNWSTVIIQCSLGSIFTEHPLLDQQAYCLKIGDAFVDGLSSAGGNTQISMSQPLVIHQVGLYQRGLTDTNLYTNLWCDGCSGELRTVMTKVSTTTNAMQVSAQPLVFIASGPTQLYYENYGYKGIKTGISFPTHFKSAISGKIDDVVVHGKTSHAVMVCASLFTGDPEGCKYGDFNESTGSIIFADDFGSVTEESSWARIEIMGGNLTTINGDFNSGNPVNVSTASSTTVVVEGAVLDTTGTASLMMSDVGEKNTLVFNNTTLITGPGSNGQADLVIKDNDGSTFFGNSVEHHIHFGTGVLFVDDTTEQNARLLYPSSDFYYTAHNTATSSFTGVGTVIASKLCVPVDGGEFIPCGTTQTQKIIPSRSWVSKLFVTLGDTMQSSCPVQLLINGVVADTTTSSPSSTASLIVSGEAGTAFSQLINENIPAGSVVEVQVNGTSPSCTAFPQSTFSLETFPLPL